MKNRIKYMALLGAAVLTLASGCGTKTESSEINAPVQEEASTDAEEVPVQETTEIPAAEMPQMTSGISVKDNFKMYYLSEMEFPYMYLQYCDVTVNEEGNLKNNIENWSLERSEELRGIAASCEKQAQETEKNKAADLYYSIYQEVYLGRTDAQVISLVDELYTSLNGDHGETSRQGITFDAQTGKRLELSDLCLDYEPFKKEAISYIKECLLLTYENELLKNYEETVETMFAGEEDPSWYLDASGITVILPEESVGPFTMGIAEIHLSYEQFKQYLKQAYVPEQMDGIARLGKNEQVILNVSAKENETKKVPFELSYRWEDDWPVCSLKLGEKTMPMESFATLEHSYLIQKDGEIYCMVGVDQASDDYDTYIYRLTEGKIQETGSVMAAIDTGNMNLEEIVMEERVNFLGSYDGQRIYRFNENHELETEETELNLWKNDKVLTTTIDLPVTLGEKQSVLPAGSHMIIKATDDQTYVKFIIQETGQTGVLNVTRAENDYYSISIDGKDEHECFEVLPYAG